MFERIFVALAVLVVTASSFSPLPHLLFVRQNQTPILHLYSTSTDPSEMKLREIQAELKDMGVSYSDCFDRDSLTRRLKEARSGKVKKTEPAPKEQHTYPSAQSTFDRDATLQELRSLRVKELRTELANRNIRWGNMVEKEDLVQALLAAREAASNFSSSGVLTPGKVSDIDADTLTTELSTPAGTPLLLDVYATWCGPCQMMAPEFSKAAVELGDTVRVAKIDSDKYPDWASKLKVGGLPTVIVFDAAGNELERVEGALMKDGLVQLARKNM
jgi:thioredoxin